MYFFVPCLLRDSENEGYEVTYAIAVNILLA